MKKTIGIDLGTTYSVITVPERRIGERFFNVPEFPDVSIVLDDKGRFLIPSAVGENVQGELVVGIRAKRLVGTVPGPFLFSKRWMGENMVFKMKSQPPMRPVDAAAEILKHLKKTAEDALECDVTDAVITVPAYFSLNAKQLTEVAGTRAGLNVAKIFQEPVAAAQVFLANDPREKVTVMTYDLGGGTFDVSIVRKEDGFGDNLAFSGDSALGGFNFDKLLADWIKQRILERHADSGIEVNDTSIDARIMDMAERCKIALSNKDRVEVKLSESGLQDKDGNVLSDVLEICRSEFEEMILPDLRNTLVKCEEARVAAKIEKSEIDVVLLIGGSSKIPLVSELLEREYNQLPHSIHPDLCVGLGAGMAAGKLGISKGVFCLDHIPEETDLEDFDVTGQVEVGDFTLPNEAGLSVVLTSVDGAISRSNPVSTGTGGFSLLDIPLQLDEENEFVLIAKDGNGRQLGEAISFAVRHRSDGAGGVLVTSSDDVLSKPISIFSSEGMKEVISEGESLPHEVTIQASTTDTTGQVVVPIYEDNREIGRVEISQLEKSLPVGTQLSIKLGIDPNYNVHVEAHIPSVDREAFAKMRLRERELKSANELRRDFLRVSALAEEVLTGGGTDTLFAGGAAIEIKRLQEEAERHLEQRNPDALAVQNCLEKLESLSRNLDNRWKPKPLRIVFDQVMEETLELLHALFEQYPEYKDDGYEGSLSAISDAANVAFQNQNSVGWSEAFSRLKQLRSQIDSITQREKRSVGEVEDSKPMDVDMIFYSLSKDMENLKSQAMREKRFNEEWKSDFETAQKELDGIDLKAGDARSLLVDFFRTRLKDLQERLERALTGQGFGGAVKIETVL